MTDLVGELATPQNVPAAQATVSKVTTKSPLGTVDFAALLGEPSPDVQAETELEVPTSVEEGPTGEDIRARPQLPAPEQIASRHLPLSSTEQPVAKIVPKLDSAPKAPLPGQPPVIAAPQEGNVDLPQARSNEIAQSKVQATPQVEPTVAAKFEKAPAPSVPIEAPKVQAPELPKVDPPPARALIERPTVARGPAPQRLDGLSTASDPLPELAEDAPELPRRPQLTSMVDLPASPRADVSVSVRGSLRSLSKVEIPQHAESPRVTTNLSPPMTTTAAPIMPQPAISPLQFGDLDVRTTLVEGSDLSFGALDTDMRSVQARASEIVMTRQEVTARSIPIQVAEAVRVSGGNDGTIEVRLQPEELGRVRVAMTPGEVGTQVTLVAERSETLDLLRRHVGLLEADLRQQGYSGLSFAFSQDGSEEWSSPMDGAEDGVNLSDELDDTETLSPRPTSSQMIAPGHRINLRL